jgi:hypothetical protein
MAVSSECAGAWACRTAANKAKRTSFIGAPKEV